MSSTLYAELDGSSAANRARCGRSFTGLDEEVAALGGGCRVELVAPFGPATPGADAYVSELR